MPSIKQVKKTNISDNVYNQMMEMIVSGQWQVGDKIPSENELKDLFNISRNTVRTNISRLNALGLLESRQGEGTFVKKLDLAFYLNAFFPSMLLEGHDIQVLLEFERGLQSESVRLACERRTEEQLKCMQGFLDNMKIYADTDRDKYLNNDLDFHVLVCEMTFNELYVKCIQVLRRLLYYALGQIVNQNDSSDSIRFHEEIMRAVSSRDSALATRFMNDHMDDVIHKYKKTIKDPQNF